MTTEYILLNYYTNLDILLDRFMTFLLIFSFLTIGSITRNVLFSPTLTRKQLLTASLFNSIILLFLSKYLIKIFQTFYFPLILGVGLIQKEFIQGLMQSKIIKNFKKTIYGDDESEKKAIQKRE